MSRISQSSLLRLVMVCLFVACTAQLALAIGTPSGTQIDNSATLNYSVGGINQNQITSNVASFVVDNRIDLTVTSTDAAAVVVTPGGTNTVLTFRVINTGNTVQDYSLSALPGAGNLHGVTDNFDANNVRVFVDGNANGVYDPGADIQTYIDELAADAMITVFIISDIPIDRIDRDGAIYDLVAQTAQGGVPGTLGADILSDDAGIADDPASIQIVFADGAGSADDANDGRFSDRGVYVVGSALLTINKSSLVTSDPINGGTNPKAIPGATIRYTINVANTGSVSANAVMVTDQIPANTRFVSASITTANSNGGAIITVEYSDNGTDWYNTETTPVNYIRVTNSVVDNTSGTAQVTFNTTIM